jgi:DMSO/TMAO reductase YedYZ molybdopterin-dependent catalytic subunit
MKSNQTDLKKRLFKSCTFGAFFFVFIFFAFHFIQTAKPQSASTDDASRVFRKAFEWNEALWSKLQSNERLSPPVKPPQKEFRVNGDLGLNSDLDPQHYRVHVESGAQKLDLPLSAFQALPKTDYSTLFKCIEGWSEPLQYGGARFSDFMKIYHLGTKPDGSLYSYVGLETPDHEYYVSIDMDSMLHPQTVLAYEMNGQSLDVEKRRAP